MKKKVLIPILLFAGVLGSCAAHQTAGNSGKVPPGQAKKVYGTKSAKPFTPAKKD